MSALAVLLAQQAAAQLINVRTIPVAQAEHFGLFPAANQGMGGVRIALPDSMFDPFANPATAARLRLGRLFSAPGLYSVSSSAGGGNMLPVGALFSAGSWFGGAGMALQEIKPGQPENGFFPPGPFPTEGDAASVPDMTPNRARGNALGALLLGRRFSQSGLALAGSVQWAKMNAVDGVDLLYDNSRHVNQSGYLLDARIGLLRESTTGSAIEATLLHRRMRMNHDVTFVDVVWNPETQNPIEVPRLESNLDHTRTWGLNLGYRRQLAGTPWQLGVIATANHMTSPHIPGYQAEVPAEAGNTQSFNLGFGVARVSGGETFGLDLIYEPARSHTWASSNGLRTLDNRYRFSNGMMRLGFGWDLDPASPTTGATLQLGLDVRAVRYRLDQDDLAADVQRQMAAAWTEWSPTWGLGFSFASLNIRYNGRVLHGAGRPGTGQNFPCCLLPGRLDSVSPSVRSGGPGAFGFTDVRLVTHQLTLSLPLR